MRSRLRFCTFVAFATIMLFSQTALCADYDWRGAGTGGNTATDPSNPTTLWGNAGNWSPATVPGSGDTAWLRLTNAGHVNAQDSSFTGVYVDGPTTEGALYIGPGITFIPRWVVLGYNSGGNLVQTGGTHNTFGDNAGASLTLGYNTGSTGSYTLSNGQLNSQNENVGLKGTGTFSQTGGGHTVNGQLWLGNNAGSSGSYTLSNGTLNVLSTEVIGGFGAGVFTQSGGSNTVNEWMSLGHYGGSTNSGSYTLSNGQLTVHYEAVGDSGTGTFVQNGGTHTVDWMVLGQYATGSYALSGGMMNAGREDYYTGTFTQTGGTHVATEYLNIGSASSYLLTDGNLTADSLSTDGLCQVQGGTVAVTNNLTVGGNFLISGCSQNLLASATVAQTGTLRVESGSLSVKTLAIQGTLALAGGTLRADTISLFGTAGGRIQGAGTVAGAFVGDGFSQLIASGGDLAVGDSTSWNGFRTAGTIAVGANSVTLNSRAFAVLGSLTTLNGGALVAANGVSLGSGQNLVGSGTVNAAVAAGIGSTIDAGGNLTLGDSNSYDGFFSDGRLYVHNDTVTLNDKNAAVLGSLTTIEGGTLKAANGFLLENGKNLVSTAGGAVSKGTGPSSSRFLNRGYVEGPPSSSSDWLIFDLLFKGSTGQTAGNLGFLAGFSPGDSPGVNNHDGNTLLGGVSSFDLGGKTPGNNDGHYSEFNVSGNLAFADGATLLLSPWGGFVPDAADTFTILTWGGSLSSSATLSVDPWFADHGINFSPTWGSNSLVLTAAPEPSTLALLGVGAIGLLAWAWRRRKRIGCKRMVLISVISAVLAGVGQLQAGVVDTRVNPSNGHTYHLLSPNTWTVSEAEAVSLGGHLATVRSAEEEAWIWSNFGAASGNTVLRYVWIGLNDVGADGNFVWASGEPVTYTDWVPNEPSGDNGPPYHWEGQDYVLEDFVQMGYESVTPIYRWNDLVDVPSWGGRPLQGVAEVVPEPSTLALLGIGAIGVLACGWRWRKRACRPGRGRAANRARNPLRPIAPEARI